MIVYKCQCVNHEKTTQQNFLVPDPESDPFGGSEYNIFLRLVIQLVVMK